MKSANLTPVAGAKIPPRRDEGTRAVPAHPRRWSRWGRIAAAAGFWFFLIKGLVWLALLGAAVFFGIDVVQAMPPPLGA